MKKKIYGILLGVILLVALVLRVNQLNTIPVGMTDDEVRLTYSAYSLWLTGRDIAQGVFLPFSFVLHNFSFTPVSVYITAPFVGLFGLSPLIARLPFALAGVGVVLLAYLLVKRLVGNHAIALIAAGVLSVNVWAIHLSRIAYESGFALLFYLLGVYACTNRRFLLSMVFLFLAFNSYNATKLIYLPLVCILVWFTWKEIRVSRWYGIAIIASVIFTLVTFWYFSLVQGAGAHGGDMLVFQNSGAASQAVELARRASAAPQILQTLYHNKLTYFTDIIARHYLYAFSPDFLFLNQEASGIYSLWARGNLYLFELPFLLIGMGALFVKQRKVFLLTFAFLLISAIPSGIGPEPFTYATRSSFMLPWLALLVAFGLYNVVQKMKIFVVVVIVLYGYFIAGYITQYYFEWPRYSAKSFAKDQKDIISFIQNYPYKQAKFLITNVSDMFFLQYAFYTKMDPQLVQDAYQKNTVPSELGNVRVLPTCARTIPVGLVYIASQSCHTQKPDKIIFLPDGQAMWNIYNLPK